LRGRADLNQGRDIIIGFQGPDFLMEYDNTQDKANHIPLGLARFTERFLGKNLLRKHYDQGGH